MRILPRKIGISGVVTFIYLWPFAVAGPPVFAAFEPSFVLQASKVLPPDLKQQGPHYRVDDAVPSDGYLLHFTIRSDYGTFAANSPDILRQRIAEIGALARLEKVSQSEAFSAGFEASANEFGRQVKDLFTEPVDTVKGIPKGVGGFFARVSRGAKTGMQKLGDMKEQEQHPEQPLPQGPGSSLPGKPQSDEKKNSSMSVQEASLRMTGEVAANAFGYDDQRRRIAKEVQVDPYSTNPVLTKKLDELAKASFAGGLGISVFKAVIPGSMLISTSTTLSDWVWDTTPGALKVRDESSLQSMDVSQEMIDRLFRQPHFTLTLQTRLVNALLRLKGVAGRPHIMPVAVTVASFDQARFVVDAMEMLAYYHENKNPLTRLETEIPFAGRTRIGGLVVAGPVDYLSWTKQFQHFAERPDLSASERILLLRGQATPMALKELDRLQWKVQMHTTGR